MLSLCSQYFFRVGKKAGKRQKKPILSAPSSQAWWQGVFINSVCTSMASSKATWNSAQGCSISHCTNHRGTALSAHSVAFTGPGTQKPLKEGSTTGDSALSHCICGDESLLNTTTVVLFQVLFQPLLCQLLYTMAYFWGGCGRHRKVRLNMRWRSLHVV